MYEQQFKVVYGIYIAGNYGKHTYFAKRIKTEVEVLAWIAKLSM